MNVPNARTDPRRLGGSPDWPSGLTPVQEAVAVACVKALGGTFLRGWLDPEAIAADAGTDTQTARAAIGQLAELGILQQTGTRHGFREWRALPRAGGGHRFAPPDKIAFGPDAGGRAAATK